MIQGVEAEEREVIVTIEMPMPEGISQAPAFQMAIHNWGAKSGETLRVPALRELAAFNAWQEHFMNPAAAMSAMPGLGNMMDQLTAAMKGDSFTLRWKMEMSMTGSGAGTPIMQMDQELVELSSAPIDNSVFQLPADYTAVTLEQLAKEWTAATSKTAAVKAGESAAPPRDATVKAYVPSLNAVDPVEPEYPEAARAQKSRAWWKSWSP